MSDYESHLILQSLDEPLRLLFWTVDEGLLLLSIPFLAILLENVLAVFIIGAGLFWALKKVKKWNQGGNLNHLLYWSLPANKRMFPKSPPSYIREYFG